MAREYFQIEPFFLDGARVLRSIDPANVPETHKIGEDQYRIVCDFIRDTIGGTGYGNIESNAEDTDRAWLDGVAAVIAELATRNQLLAQIDVQAREIVKLEETIVGQENQIDRHDATRQTLNELCGDYETATIELANARETIRQQATVIAALNERIDERDQLRALLDKEIIKLNSRLQSMRDVANAEIAKRDGLPFDQRDDIGWEFARQMTEAPAIGGAFMGVAAIGAELASVRMMANNPKQREIDPVGFGKRLATIAGYALQLYRDDRKGDPTVAKGPQPS